MSVSNAEPPIDVPEYVATETVLSSEHVVGLDLAAENQQIPAETTEIPLQVNSGATGPLNMDCESISNTPVSDIISSLSPIPKCEKKRKRARKVETAAVLTSTPYKTKILEKQRLTEEKISKKKITKQTYALKCTKQNSETKVMCRKDKRPAKRKLQLPKEPVIQKDGVSKKGNRMVKKSSAIQKNKEDYFCLICDELYIDPPLEDWMQCKECSGWAHEACTDGEQSTGYECDYCR